MNRTIAESCVMVSFNDFCIDTVRVVRNCIVSNTSS